MKKLSQMIALVASLFFAGLYVNTAAADANPFAQADQVNTFVAGDEGKCGEGKCGDKKGKKEGKCGEGKCGDKKKGKKEGKCGEGKCGGK